MSPRRILAIWCADLALDRWRLAPGCDDAERRRRRAVDAAPLVLITDTAHGPRIEAVNHAGRAAGARRSMMLADARAVCSAIVTAPFEPGGDCAFLESLAVWAQRWGPWTAIDAPDGVLVDVTAVAHLFGGEALLLADVEAAFARRRLSIRAAIAPTAGAAWALAHYGPASAIHPPPTGEGDRSGKPDLPAILADLPVAALRLDEKVLRVLQRLGLKRVEHLHTIGRDALQRRFRNRKSPDANPLIRLDQLLGRAPEPLLPVLPRIAPMVQRRVMEPIRHRTLLDQVVADLAHDMVRLLEGQGLGVRRLELGLWRVDGEVVVRRLEMAMATRDAAHMCRLFAARLDDVDAGFGIELLRLRASWTQPLALAQQDVEAAAETQGTSLGVCIDRLTVRLGQGAVTRPVPYASHLPERAQRWCPPLEAEPPAQAELAFHARPLKLLDKAEAIAVLYATPDGYPRRFRWRGTVHEVARVEGPERIAPEWWRESGKTRLRDYYRIEDDAGRRYWIYRQGIEGDGRGGLPDWYLQGLCA